MGSSSFVMQAMFNMKVIRGFSVRKLVFAN